MSENDSSRYRRGLSRRPGTMSLQSALRMIRSRWTTFLAISLFMLASEIALKAFLVSESSEVQISGEGRSFFAKQAFHKRTEGQYAYVTFLCDDELLPSTRVLLHSLQKVGSQYPVLVLALSQVSREARWELQMLGGQVVGIGKLQSPYMGALEKGINHQCRYSKLHMFGMTDYDKLLYLDADTMVTRNLDHVFELDYDIAGARDVGNVINTGVLLLRPSKYHYRQMLKKHEKAPSYNSGDQGFLHWYFGQAQDLKVGILEPDYNVQGKQLHYTVGHAAYKKAHVLHFTAETKPWSFYSYTHKDWAINFNHAMFTTWKLAEHETNTKLDALKAETEGHDVNDAFAETQGGQVFAVSDEETLLQARRKVLVDTMKGKGEAKYASKQHEVCTNHSGLTAEDKPYLRQQSYSVVLAFHNEARLSMLSGLLKIYRTSLKVDQIYVVWTAPIDPPFEVHSLATVVRPEQDSLNARFRMLPGLKTQAVFIADDDVLYDMQDVDAMFDAWKGRPFSPHGFWARSHSYSQGQAQYLDSALTNYSMVLTKGMMINSRYLHTYTCLLPAEIHDYIDSRNNCEDIAMNMMIAGMTGSPAVLYSTDFIKDFGTTSGISNRLSASVHHINSRSECLTDLVSLFGRMPLMHSNDMLAPFRPNKFTKNDPATFPQQ